MTDVPNPDNGPPTPDPDPDKGLRPLFQGLGYDAIEPLRPALAELAEAQQRKMTEALAPLTESVQAKLSRLDENLQGVVGRSRFTIQLGEDYRRKMADIMAPLTASMKDALSQVDIGGLNPPEWFQKSQRCQDEMNADIQRWAGQSHCNWPPGEAVQRKMTEFIAPIGKSFNVLSSIGQTTDVADRIGSRTSDWEAVAKTRQDELQRLIHMEDVPAIAVENPAWVTARHTKDLSRLAREQQALLQVVSDQLAESEQRRAEAEKAASDAEANRYSESMRTMWQVSIVGGVVGAIVGAVVTIVLTLILLN